MLARGCLVVIGMIVLLIAGCAVRSALTEAELQRTVFPAVRAEAARVHRVLGIEGASLQEIRTYVDPFCQLYGLPMNLLSVAAQYPLEGTVQPTEVLNSMQRTLEADGWEFEPTREGGTLRVGWRGGYRVQLGTSTTGLTPAERAVSRVSVAVRNQDRSRQSGCG
jgi:hypothetical protein